MKVYLVVSYPKSGATWFRFLVYSLFHQKLENSASVGDFYPEWVRNSFDIDDYKSDKLFIKSHAAYPNNKELLDHVDEVILLTRNPLNVMTSKRDHYKYEGLEWIYTPEGELKFYSSFIREANLPSDKLNYENWHGGWNYFHKSWLNNEISVPVSIIKYEDLIDAPFNTIQSLSQKFEWNFSKDEIENAIELSSFDNIKKLEEDELTNSTPGLFFTEERRKNFLEKDARFVKKGKSRDPYIELNTETIFQTKMRFFEGMIATGYLSEDEEE